MYKESDHGLDGCGCEFYGCKTFLGILPLPNSQSTEQVVQMFLVIPTPIFRGRNPLNLESADRWVADVAGSQFYKRQFPINPAVYIVAFSLLP